MKYREVPLGFPNKKMGIFPEKLVDFKKRYRVLCYSIEQKKRPISCAEKCDAIVCAIAEAQHG